MLNPGLQSLNFQWYVYVSHGDKEQTDAVFEGAEPLTPKDIAEIVYWGLLIARVIEL
jgi:NADP-dependent 3-hydroxy acid dehydrogenase YdfG